MLYAHIDPLRWGAYYTQHELGSKTGCGIKTILDYLREVGTTAITSQLTHLTPAQACHYWPVPAASGVCIRLLA